MLKKRTAIVTGGARGIGFALAEGLLIEGADVIICSRTKDQLEQAVEKLSSKGKVFGVVANVAEFADCQKLIKFALLKTERIDILINNAGIYGPAGLLEGNKPEEWREVLAVNILGAVYCSKLVIPYMKKLGAGKIINLAGAGVGGSKPLPRFSGYYVTKSAIAALTENLGAELLAENIQVNAIAPGAVASELNMNLLKIDKSILGDQMYEMLVQLKKDGGTSTDLAVKLVSFLVSEKADHITGRLLSAKWDAIEKLKNPENFTQNMFRLRRVDNDLVFEK